MIENFKRYHLLWLPLHVILSFGFFISYAMTVSNEYWLIVGFGIIFQLFLFGLIPSIIIFFIKKNKIKDIGPFLSSSTFLLVPYFIVFIIFRIIFSYLEKS